ncbi:MAG TPA: SRPBCC family protein [Acidimicrobiales bacterium]|nr:SRPBCC family protein [Acidimicrobiales bacterium]
MPEVSYTTEIARPADEVWQYVEDFDNWAHLMIGYQKLRIVTDRQSVWTLRGDVGILSREVDVQVDITEWDPLHRVAFVVQGLTERLEGSGSFLLEEVGGDPGADGAAGPTAGGGPAPAPARRGLFYRFRLAMARSLLRRMRRRSARTGGAGTGRPEGPAAPARSAPVTTGSPAVGSRLTFRLAVTPGGPMAPMLEVLMEPMLEPAAEDLALGIRQALEGGAG